ncbi:LEPR-XLL domain-containing protein, partial [Celeribacter marinus]|uniref:LEPR-XLL domain-containing protein n=1 Tax=Celeribacter marinus TaxID=1397108 RepID=UPI003F6AEF90
MSNFKNKGDQPEHAAADNTHTDSVPGFGLETLEQRILLSGDLPLAGSDASGSGQPDAVDVVLDVTGEAVPDAPSVVAEPNLALVSGAGTRALSPDHLADAPLTVEAGVTLTGRGATGQTLTNTGTVAPGNSPGILNVTGYTQGAGATLVTEIGGT